MSKIIIGIHGLGNKPPKQILEKWWSDAICEGLKKIGKYQFKPKLELVYWADILNDKPLNSLISDPENPYYLDEPYTVSPGRIEKKPITTRKKFLGYLEDKMDKLFLNDDLSSNFNFISDLVFKKYFKELDVYYSSQQEINDPSYKSVKDIIRNRLAETLRKHKGKDILLLSHSMGTIIAYDVCNFVTPDVEINTLVTMGSPLGIPIIISKIAEEQKAFDPNVTKLKTPPNITNSWYNFSDIEDNVALNYNLADDFEANDLGVKVKDIIIENDYMVNEIRNPHKSYGYLRSPEFSNIVTDFITKDLSAIELWYYKKTNLLKEFFMGLSLFNQGKVDE